ncbi:hypothetical protein PENTCL1PPCAC_28090, partial [Pristionchus entomophagus]
SPTVVNDEALLTEENFDALKLEEKATACRGIFCFARKLGVLLIPYVEELSNLMIDHLKFFDGRIREFAADTLPHLLDCVRTERGVSALRLLWVRFWNALKQAIKSEGEIDIKSQLITSVEYCIARLGPEGLTGEELREIGAMLKEELEGYELRRQWGDEPGEFDAVTDEEFGEIINMEIAILARISDVIHTGFKTIGNIFHQVVNPLLPLVFPIIDHRRSYLERQWGLCIINDLIEFSPQEYEDILREKDRDGLIELFYQSLIDECFEVRQVAAYGFGVMAMSRHLGWADIAASGASTLASMIARRETEETDQSLAVENILEAVSEFRGNNESDVNKILSNFIHWMQISGDLGGDSVHSVHRFLEAQKSAAVGDLFSNGPELLSLLVTAMKTNVFDEKPESVQVKSQLVEILRQIRADENTFMGSTANANMEDTVDDMEFVETNEIRVPQEVMVLTNIPPAENRARHEKNKLMKEVESFMGDSQAPHEYETQTMVVGTSHDGKHEKEIQTTVVKIDDASPPDPMPSTSRF